MNKLSIALILVLSIVIARTDADGNFFLCLDSLLPRRLFGCYVQDAGSCVPLNTSFGVLWLNQQAMRIYCDHDTGIIKVDANFQINFDPACTILLETLTWRNVTVHDEGPIPVPPPGSSVSRRIGWGLGDVGAVTTCNGGPCGPQCTSHDLLAVSLILSNPFFLTYYHSQKYVTRTNGIYINPSNKSPPCDENQRSDVPTTWTSIHQVLPEFCPL